MSYGCTKLQIEMSRITMNIMCKFWLYMFDLNMIAINIIHVGCYNNCMMRHYSLILVNNCNLIFTPNTRNKSNVLAIFGGININTNQFANALCIVVNINKCNSTRNEILESKSIVL